MIILTFILKWEKVNFNPDENNLYKNDKVNKTINISNILVNILKNTFIVGFWTRRIIK